MPTGLSRIKQISDENRAKQEAYDNNTGTFRYFILEDGQKAKVRFLEQGDGVFYVWCHELPAPPGRAWGDKTPCLDQNGDGTPCPGCAMGKRKTAVVIINLIWFGAPNFLRDDKKKIVKDGNGRPQIDTNEPSKDVVAVWKMSPTTGGLLEHLDNKYQGLTNWIFDVTRDGKKKDTKYLIDPHDPVAGAAQPSIAELELAATKTDPKTVLRILSPGDMTRVFGGQSVGGGAPPQEQPAASPAPGMEGNAFAQAASGGAINKGAFGR